MEDCDKMRYKYKSDFVARSEKCYITSSRCKYDWPSGGPFQYKTLSSTRRITHSGTAECYHINENARVVKDLDIIIIDVSTCQV